MAVTPGSTPHQWPLAVALYYPVYADVRYNADVITFLRYILGIAMFRIHYMQVRSFLLSLSFFFFFNCLKYIIYRCARACVRVCEICICKETKQRKTFWATLLWWPWLLQPIIQGGWSNSSQSFRCRTLLTILIQFMLTCAILTTSYYFFGWQLIYIVYRQVHSNSANIGTHRKYALHSNDVCACTRRHTVAQLTRLHDTRTSFSSCTRVCRGTRVSFFLISTP